MAERDDANASPHGRWTCEECGSRDVSITPVPGHWLQFWCNDCDHWWWENSSGQKPA